MTKFFAMLKDSFREAVDGWIFYVMLALAGLIIVLVLSTSVTPVASDRAIPLMFQTGAASIVSPDRGKANRQAQFAFAPNVTKVVVANTDEPWSGKITCRLTVESSMLGGGEELDDTGKASKKRVEGAGFFTDALREATRYWAAPIDTPSRDRPKYTDELGAEFVKAQFGSATGLNITKVTPAGGRSFDIEADGATTKAFWPHTPNLFFGALSIDSLGLPLGKLVNLVENTLLNRVGAWVLMLAGVIFTAGFVPNMLRKGAIDLFITKPMSRPFILISKYLGGLMFVFVLCTVTVGGVWFALGMRTGIWSMGLLTAILGITFYFAILYACSTLFGVLSRNAIVCIVVTIVFWFVLYLIGFGYNTVTTLDELDFSEMQARQTSRTKPKVVKKVGEKGEEVAPKDDAEDDAPAPMPDMKPHPTLVKTMKILNAVTPRLNDVDALTTQAIAKGLLPDSEYRLTAKAANKVNWGEALGVSAAWIGLFLGLATLRFVTRSY